MFLQLYHTGPHQPAGEQPLQIGPGNIKAIALLDLIPPFETHKIGVLYVGQGQCNNEAEMFRNRHGSLRYTEFLRNLGTLVALRDAKEHNMFVNMETSGKDGKFTYIWQDDIVQVTFHVATLMPNREQDPNCYDKKKHIGNDFVTIVYNESGEEYNLNTIKVNGDEIIARNQIVMRFYFIIAGSIQLCMRGGATARTEHKPDIRACEG